MSIFNEIQALFEQTISRLSSDPQLWRRFLSNVCRNYKMRFDEQVLMFAQRPDVTAVATFEQWFSLYRPVKKGQTAINVFEDENGKSRRYKRYYDISDTITRNDSRPVNIWNMSDEYQQSVADALESNFGETHADSFENVIISSAENIANEHIQSYHKDILHSTEDSFLEGLGDAAVLSIYNQIVTNSIAYTMLSRLGYNADEYIDADNFSEIINFNTVSSLMTLGKATQQLSAIGLSLTAKAIVDYEKNYRELSKNENIRRNDARGENTVQSGKIGERRTTADRTGAGGASERVFQKDEQSVVHTRPGNMDIRTESDSTGGRATAGRNVHPLPGEIPQGREIHDVRESAVLGNTEQAPRHTYRI